MVTFHRIFLSLDCFNKTVTPTLDAAASTRGCQVDETGDGFEASIAGKDAEIRAGETQRRLCRPACFPPKSDAVIVRIHGAGETQTVPGELVLHALDHGTDVFMASAASM
jgi:hypothetical protein